MIINQIEVRNFKTFRYQKIELGAFNVLVGSNAAGKSNFLQIFQFISDITQHGLNNAISMQGGIEYLRNTNLAAQDHLTLKIIIGSNPLLTYEFALKFAPQNGKPFQIVQDKLVYTPKNEGNLGEYGITYIDGNLEITNTLGEFIPDIFQNHHLFKTLQPHQLLLEQPLFQLIMAELHHTAIFKHFSLYDFDAKQPKKAVPIAGKIQLESDSSNLAIVLKNLLMDQEKKRQFFNLLTYLLPFVEDVRIDAFTEKHFMLSLKENYSPCYLPATFLSEGTINVISLITALYFEDNPFFLMEEPEKNIYPCRLSKVMGMFKEASHNKQILITTHHSEIVKYADCENLLFILRDKDGFSTIIRPAEKEEIQGFLQSEDIGIEDLYLDDLLGI